MNTSVYVQIRYVCRYKDNRGQVAKVVDFLVVRLLFAGIRQLYVNSDERDAA